MEYYSNYDFKERDETALARMDGIAAISRTFIRGKEKWSVPNTRMLFLTLNNIDYRKEGNSNEVILSKSKIFQMFGKKVDSDHSSEEVRKILKAFQKGSFLEWTNPEDKNDWKDGMFIIQCWPIKYTDNVVVTINQEYMPLVENLLSSSYIRVFIDDICKLDDMELSLYLELWEHWDDRYKDNERNYTDKQMKDILGMKEDAYISNKNGKNYFDRTSFERQINRVCQRMNKKINSIIIYPCKFDGEIGEGEHKEKKYKFVKRKNVNGYKMNCLRYRCFTHLETWEEQIKHKNDNPRLEAPKE